MFFHEAYGLEGEGGEEEKDSNRKYTDMYVRIKFALCIVPCKEKPGETCLVSGPASLRLARD